VKEQAEAVSPPFFKSGILKIIVFKIVKHVPKVNTKISSKI